METKEGYWVYKATHVDLGIPMTLKIIQNPRDELRRYLKKLKDMKL